MKTEKRRELIAFGKAVREARKLTGLSQDDFAAQSNIHRTYIGGIERGERNPTLTAIWRIATALKSTPEALLTRASRIIAEESSK
jgi:transcriptional regulator with XRE-family HTH domain